MSSNRKWTFMVYIAGDNNLSTAGDTDLAEMRRVGSTGEVDVVAQFDNAGNHGTRRFHIRRDGADETVERLAETDSGDPRTLIDFIDWAVGNYPAQRYALVLWNHGGGWEPSEIDRVARSVGAQNYSSREVTERASSRLRRAMFRTTIARIFEMPSASERAICSDDGSGHSLDTIELARVMAHACDRIGGKVDLLGMDACLMSNFEVAYELRDAARYMVASVENEPNNGWPYDRVLKALTDDPDIETADLARTIVTEYLASYRDINHAGDVTQCAVDLAEVDRLATPLDDLATALTEHMPDSARQIWDAQRKSARFWNNTLWDVAHFCLELEASASAPMAEAARRVRAALEPGTDNFVVAEDHEGDKVSDCGGVSLYLVPPLTRISPFYAELSYAQDHRWLSLLQAYHAV